MSGLKLIVILMGVLLVAGIVALGFGIEYRVNHPRPVTPAAAPAGTPSATTLDLPEGARVVGAQASGDRLVVRVELAGGGEELIVVNLATGTPIATVTLRAQAQKGTP
jgi:hypothetical protein